MSLADAVGRNDGGALIVGGRLGASLIVGFVVVGLLVDGRWFSPMLLAVMEQISFT